MIQGVDLSRIGTRSGSLIGKGGMVGLRLKAVKKWESYG